MNKHKRTSTGIFSPSLFLYLTLTLLAIAFLPTAALAQNTNEADKILGNWYLSSKLAQIQIFKRGNKYDGKIVWLKKERDPNGNIKVDAFNPDKSLRKRPIMGLVLLRNFEYEGKNVWSGGEIYDPESGKTYNCYMKLNGDGTLDVRGYIGYSWMGMGRTDKWTRAN